MSTSSKRDNAYWAKRLQKDGHQELLSAVNAGEISMYKATQEAGYRSRQPQAVSGKLSYHWKRASYDERRQFVLTHLVEVNSVIRDLRADIIAKKNRK